MYRTPEEIMEAEALGVTLGDGGEVVSLDGPPQGPQPPPPPPPPGPGSPTPPAPPPAPEVPTGWRRNDVA